MDNRKMYFVLFSLYFCILRNFVTSWFENVICVERGAVSPSEEKHLLVTENCKCVLELYPWLVCDVTQMMCVC